MSKLALALTLVAAVAAAQAAELQYSGDNWDAGGTTGTMTITAVDGPTTLWTLDLYNVQGTGVTLSTFTDGGAFNYAAGEGNFWGWGLMSFGHGGFQNKGEFAQVTKTADEYVFTLSMDVSVDFNQLLTYTISKPDASGTTISATYLLTHIGVAPASAWSGCELISFYNIGAAGEAFDYVTDYELALGSPDVHVGRVHQRISDQAAGLWSVTENVDGSAGPVDANAFASWTATVLDNSETSTAGMTAGLEFASAIDVYPYYPSPSVGNASVVDGSVTYNDGLELVLEPREWQDGPVRPSPYPVMSPTDTYTVNASLTINITGASAGNPGDIDGDGDVDLDDFVILKTNFGL